VKTHFAAALVVLPIAAIVCGCGSDESAVEALRPVRTVEVSYGTTQQTNRYSGSVQARYEVDQAFRVSGKIAERKVDVGDTVRAGDVLAVLDDRDYRLAAEVAGQQLISARTEAQQAESDRQRLEALKLDGSVSDSDEEHAQSRARTTQAAVAAQTRQLELARNRLSYTVLRASLSGVVTAVRFEVGQVLAEGQPVVSIANQEEPEIVVDVPEDHFASFKTARFKASLASAPAESFDVILRELSLQAAPQTRTYRARLKPVTPRHLPLGATATLVAERVVASSLAVVPTSAITQQNERPAVWVVRRAEDGEAAGTVELSEVEVHEYRNDDVLVSGLPAGELVVTAGVHKMAPGLKVALPSSGRDEATRRASR